MLSRHRIEKCTLQIALPSENNLEVVKLLAQEKPRILEAILAVLDREVPENLQISLSKIHLDLGTVSRQNFIQTLTDRLIALLSAELERLANDPSIRASRTNRGEPNGAETPFSDIDSPARINPLPDESMPGLHMGLLPSPAAMASQRSEAVPTDTLLAVIAQYFRTGTFPYTFKALLPTDVSILVNYLVESKARPFADYLSRRIGMTSFQLKLAESLPYDTLLSIARLLPALNTSLPAWLTWIEKVHAEGVSAGKYTSRARRFLLQYLTAASLHDRKKIQEEYRQTAVRADRDDTVVTYTGQLLPIPFFTIPTPEDNKLYTKKRLLYLHDLFQAHRHSPVVRHSIAEGLTLLELRAVVQSLGVAHGSYTHWLVFVRKVKDLYTAEHTVLSDNVKRTMYRRYIDLISTQPKSSVTFARLEQFLLLELQLLSSWPQAASHPATSTFGAAIPAGETVAITRSSARGQAKQPDVQAFAIVRFYYRYGYFPTAAQHLRAADLEALILYLLAWNPARLTQYVLTLAGNVTYTARLADTLSANTLKTILSASGRVSNTLAEWNLWEQILKSVIAKTTFLSFADKFTLFQYVSAPSGSIRGKIIHEYILSLYTLKKLPIAPHTIMRELLRCNCDDDTQAAALERIVTIWDPFREAYEDALGALREDLANVDTSVTQETRRHPSYAYWIAFQTRVHELLTELGVQARDEILQELQYYYRESLHQNSDELLSPEKLPRHLLQRAEPLLAAAIPEVDAALLRMQFDASVTGATLHWRSVLKGMIRYGIRHVVSNAPALQQLPAIDALWDTALADEAAVFSLFHAADVTPSFWSELSEILSLDRLHRLLSILAPFQYQGLAETGVMNEDRPTTRETFSLAFTTLHDTRFAITTEKLIDRIFHLASISIPGDALTSLPIPAASGSPDAPTPPAPLLPADNVAARLLTMLAEDISLRRTTSARERWRLLYRNYPSALVLYSRTQWSWTAWRDSLALDADLDILIGLTASLWRDEPSYNVWQNFTVPYMHHERSLRAMHRYYFDFLTSTHQDYASAVFTRSLADFAKTLDAQPDATFESLAGVHIKQEPVANPDDVQDTKHDNAEALVEPISTADVVPPSGIEKNLSTDYPEANTNEAPSVEHDQDYGNGIEEEPARYNNTTEIRGALNDGVHELFAALYIATTDRATSATILWRSLYADYRQELVQYIRTHRHPEPILDSLALDAGVDILLRLSAILYQDDTSYSPWVAFTKRFGHDVVLLRQGYQHYFRFLRGIGHGSQSPQPFSVWLNSLGYRLNIPATRAQTPEPPPVASPDAPEGGHSVADVIVYYLKTGLFIPGSGAADTAALTKITTRYFSEVSPNDSRIMAIAHDNPEAYRRLKPLLSSAALSLLQESGSTIEALPPHYTTSRIKTLQQIEATLHYWLYEQWPWWYISTTPPMDTATATDTLEKHLELFTERLKASGHEVAIIQKIASRLPQAFFLEMIGIRFPTVAGFVTRVLLLVEKMSLEGENTPTFPLHATFAVVYDHLAHHIDPFSALQFLSVLARHSATLINLSEPTWIARMADLAAMQGENSPYWSLHTLLVSLDDASRETSLIADTLQSPAMDGTSALLAPPTVEADRGFTDSLSPTFKEAFVAYLRLGIIPVHTQESEGGKPAFTRQLQVVALQEHTWLTTTLKNLFKNTDTLDAYLLRSDPSITISIIGALAGTRQQEFSQWAHMMENFLNTLSEKSDGAIPGPFQASLLAARSLLLLLLQRPASKITAIQYAQAVLGYSIQHSLTKGPDTLLKKIQQLKASPVSEHFVISLEVAHAQLTAHARSLLLQSLTGPNVKVERTTPALEKGVRIPVEGAGIVLIAPFFYMYFNRLEMIENNSFKSNAHAVRAVHLLHYLVSGHTEAPRQSLLYNLLCGADLFLPLADTIELTDHEIQVSESLLQGVLQNWTSLQSKSVDALRETFLQRAGHIEENEIGWNLTVDRKSVDILVDWIPWSFSLIKLSWMEKSLAVHWQSDQYRDLMPMNT